MTKNISYKFCLISNLVLHENKVEITITSALASSNLGALDMALRPRPECH